MSSKRRLLLLDTHALVDYARGEGLPAKLELSLEEARRASRLFVSSISFWEVALLVQKGRLALSNVLRWAEQVLNASGIQLLQPTIADMVTSAELPLHHKDPFDRLLIAQTNGNGMELVTRDARITAYEVSVFWNE